MGRYWPTRCLIAGYQVSSKVAFGFVSVTFFFGCCVWPQNETILYIISIGSLSQKTSTSMWGTPSEKDPKMKPWVGEKLDRKHLRVVLDDTLRPWTEAQQNMELNFRWVKEFILLIVISDDMHYVPLFCLRVHFSKMPPFYRNFTYNATLKPENSMRTIWHFRRLWIQSGSSSGPWYC